MQGLALVDCHNFWKRGSSSVADLENDVVVLVTSVVRCLRSIAPDISEIDFRLYGGWTTAEGYPSPDALKLSGLLPSFRGRRNGILVRPELATSLISHPHLHLRGTVRGHGRNRRQKMVDGLLGCDAIYIATNEAQLLAIVSDDDDLLPAALYAFEQNADIATWIRARRVGSGINDNALMELGLRILSLGDGTP